MQNYYLITLLISLCGLLYADKQYSLCIFGKTRASLRIITVGVLFFLQWDIVGIILGVFATNRDWVSGAYVVTPNLPIEEFGFLLLFCYLTLLLWRLTEVR